MAISKAMRQDIMELAVLMNNKSPGTKLLGELVAEANAGKTLTEIAGTLAARAEFIKDYPAHQTAEEFGAEWIANILPEASAALQTECVGIVEASINAGTSIAALVVSVQDFMSNASEADAALGTHIKNFNNKVTVATYHTITQEAEAEWAIPATVTSDATTVTSANAAVDTALAPVVVAEASKNLVMKTTAEVVEGGGADDTISAVVTGAGAGGSTLLPGDVVNGGGGTDTLTISTAGAPAGVYTIAAIQTTGVENIMFNAYDTENTTDGTQLDMTLMTGVQKVGASSGSASGDLYFNNVQNLVDVSMSNSSADLKVAYTAATVFGTSTVQNIALNNNTAGAFTFAGVETINLTSGLLNNALASLTATSLRELNISGDKNINLGTALDFANWPGASMAIGATNAKIDASGLTGKLTVTSAADNSNYTGGSGNDTFVMVATMNGFDKIDGGDGTDTITMNRAALTTQFSQTSNVEVLSINSHGTSADSYDLSKFGGSTFVLDLVDTGGNDNANTVATIAKADGKTVTLAKVGSDGADANDNEGATVTITNTTDTSADTVNLTLAQVGTATAANKGYRAVDVATFETVNITANANAAGTATNEVTTLTASEATAITVTGTGELTTTLSGAKVTSFDASALAGKLVLTTGASPAAATATYKMGGKSSTLTMAGNLNALDIIEGGAGTADTVTATVTGLSATTGALNITGVENITLTTSGANTLALAGTSGYKTVSVTDNKQTITGFDLGATIGLGIVGAAADSASEIDVTASDATGAADNLNVKVDNTQAATDSIIDVGAAVETATFTTQAANTVTLNMTTAEVANIVLAEKAATNSGTIALGTLHKNTTSVSSTADAPVTVVFNQAAVVGSPTTFTGKGTGIQNVTGGAFADTITIGSTGNITHVVDGGAGTDTVNITAAATFVNPGSIDAENVNMTVVAGADVNFSGAAPHSGVDNLVVTGGNSLSTLTTNTIHTNMKTVDLSGFAGNGVFTLAADAADNTVTLTGGPLATDTLAYQITGAGTDTPQTSGIEAIVGNIDSTSTLNMSKSDAALLSLDVATGIVSTLAAMENTTARITATAGTPTVVVGLADSTGSADTATIELKGANTGAIANGLLLQTTDIETVTIKAATAGFSEQINLSLLSMATAGKTMALNLTGTGGFAITNLNADVTSIDASGKTLAGGVVQTGRSSTAAADYKGGKGDDTFMMTQEADVMAAGGNSTTSKTVAGDNLDIDFTPILAGISINLAADDQVISLNGATNTAVQSGFESVDVSGLATFGASIVGSKVSNTIVGTGAVDSINGAGGADKITSGAGADIVTGGTGADQFVVSNTEADADTIMDFTDGATGDVLDLSGVLTLDASAAQSQIAGGTFNVVAAGGTGAVAFDTGDIVILTGNTAAVGTKTLVGAEFGAGQSFEANTANDNFIVLAVNTQTGHTTVYEAVDGGNTAIAAGELTVIGTLQNFSAAQATLLVDANFGL
jgi:hypothetical protein